MMLVAAGISATVLVGCSTQPGASGDVGPYSGSDAVGTWVGTYTGINTDDEYVTWDMQIDIDESDGVSFRGYRSFVDELLEPATTYVKGVVTADGQLTMHESDSVFQGTLSDEMITGTFLGAGDAESIFVVELTKE